MGLLPTEQMLNERASKYVYPGENLYVRALAWEQPSWGWILLIGSLASFFYKYYVVGVKETGLIVHEVSMWGYKEKSAAIIPWNGIFNATFKPGMLQDILSFQTADGRLWNLRLQKMAGLTDNRGQGKLLADYVISWSQAVQQHA